LRRRHLWHNRRERKRRRVSRVTRESLVDLIPEFIERAVDVFEPSFDLCFEAGSLFIGEESSVCSPVRGEFVEDAVERLAEALVAAFVSFQVFIDFLFDANILRDYSYFMYEFVYTLILAVRACSSNQTSKGTSTAVAVHGPYRVLRGSSYPVS
jgi:hypothetical protein